MSGSTDPRRPSRFRAAFAALAVITAVWLLVRKDTVATPDDGTPDETAGAAGDPTLLPGERIADARPQRTQDADVAPTGTKTSPKTAADKSDTSHLRPKPRAPDVGMSLLGVEGDERTLEVLTVRHRGTQWHGAYATATQNTLRIFPNAPVIVTTADPRSYFRHVIVPIGEIVPEHIAVEVPAHGDERLNNLSIRAVDARTNAPVPFPKITWRGRDAASMHQGSQDGLISVDENVKKFIAGNYMVHAAGYVGTSGRGLGFGEFEPGGIDLPTLNEWMTLGTVTVPLVPSDPPYEERALRIVHSDGSAAIGCDVCIAAPHDPIHRYPTHAEFRRVPRDGVVSFPIATCVGVEIRIRDVLIDAHILARSRWQGDAPRLIKLPPLSHVTLTVTDVDDAQRVYVYRDPMGRMRTPSDGPLFPVTRDPEAAKYLGDTGLRLSLWIDDMTSDGNNPCTLTLPSDREHRLLISTKGPRRVLRLHPDQGAFNHTVSLTSLPLFDADK